MDQTQQLVSLQVKRRGVTIASKERDEVAEIGLLAIRELDLQPGILA